MDETELCFTPATELAELIASRAVSPVEATRAVLARIDRLQPGLNAFVTVSAERALDDARAAEQALMSGATPGPLHGVPFSVKDLCNTAGVRTTFGSHGYEDNVPEADIVAVARLKAAGAILIGKTTTPEFGHKPLTEAPLFGRTVNPWDGSRTCGGSSGGAGAAVAAGMAPLAVGTDGGGSVRIPAACCGIVGMKQTLGVVPHDQTPDVFGLLAYVGPMARTVADTALMLDAMAGPHRSDPHSLGRTMPGLAAAGRPRGDMKGVRVGWRPLLGNARIDSETLALCETGVRALADLGAEVVDHDAPFTNTLPVWGPLTFSIWASRFGALEKRLGNRMSSSLRTWMAEGAGFSAVDVQDAMALRTRVYREVEAWFENIDLLATPTLSRPALPADQDPMAPIEIEGTPAGGLRDGWYPYTHPFNLTGHPAITVPCGWTADGLPVGLQIVGPWLSDARILRAAALFEEARPWRGRRPPV
ncbi:MAG: amidase [Alphaproteobacteria bacterium]